MLQKVKRFDPAAVKAEKILEMLTIEGAKVLGLDNITGSLEEGKRADIILLDFDKPHLMNSLNIVPKIVYSARGSDVVSSIIDGQIVMEDRVVQTMDEKECMINALKEQQDLIEKGGEEVKRMLSNAW